jgi:diguanylate cyclase (GGDEF)-like protein
MSAGMLTEAQRGGTWMQGTDPAEQLRTMRRVAVAMYIVGGLTCLTGVWTTQRGATSQMWQAIWSATFIALGLILAAMRPRRRVLQVSALLGIVTLSGLMATADPIGMTPLFYVWPVVFCAYFFSRRMVVAAVALMTVTLAVGLVLNQAPTLKMDAFTGAVSTAGLLAALVASMQRRDLRLRAELAKAALTDPLTGLLNRRSFNPQLEALIASRSPLSLALFDIDHFKRFNDDHGHIAGDQALRRVADLLQENSKDGDLVARFGGEEFAVALPGADADGARRYAERLARVLEAGGTDNALALSVSAGIATLGDSLDSFDALISHADDALYAAKRAGRARAAWWDGTLHVGQPATADVPALAA